ncbi:hypothetical protein KCU65_g5767, partial [Aureobasidium melanogenum]
MPLPNSFQAAIVPEQGAQHIVETRTLVHLEYGELAIKITATAINPIDWKMRDWHYWLKEYPAVLGSDAAGEVVTVADGVENLKEGDRVFFQGIIANYDSSTFQQFCKMPASLVAKTPSNITDDQAAGISLATVAGLTAFYDQTGLNLRPLPWEQDGDKAGEGKAVVNYWRKLLSRPIRNPTCSSLWLLQDHHQLKSKPPQTHMLALQIVQSATNVDNALVVRVNLEELDREVQQQSKTDRVVDFKPIVGASSFPNLRPLIEAAWEKFGRDDGFIARGLFQPNSVTVIHGGLASVDEALKRNEFGVSGTKVIIRPFETQESLGGIRN